MGDIVVQRLVKGNDGSPEPIYFDPMTGIITKNPVGKIVVDEQEVKSGKVSPTKPNAVPRIIRQDDGTNATIWVDVKTGQQIDDPSKYNLLDQFNSNVTELGLVKQVTPEEQNKEETKTEIPDKPADRGTRDNKGGFVGKSLTRNEVNNFGYINRPDIMNYGGFLPGPIGMAAKMANVGLNANNLGATTAAQNMLGFENRENKIGQIASDKKGYVGDLSYGGDVTTSVGLEATDKYGRTTLTPTEARMRESLLGAKQATEEEKNRNIDQFRKENPSIVDRARDFIKTRFGGEEQETIAPQVHETKETPAAQPQSSLNDASYKAYRDLDSWYDGPKGIVGPQNTSKNVPSAINTDESNTERPSFAPNLGMTAAQAKERASKFSDEDKSAMARTLAGEVDLRRTDLTTPIGRQEAFGILSTMENRAPKYGSAEQAAFAPKQYSTWNNSTFANTAMANYNMNKEVYDGIVNDFVQNPENHYGFTSYYNPDIAAPAWGDQMQNPSVIGPHKFGSLAEYGPDQYRDLSTSLGQLQGFENDRETRVGYNQAAQSSFASGMNAQRDYSPSYSSRGSFSEDRADRASQADKTRGGNSTGSMADARANDRSSVNGYSGGTRTSGGGFSEDRADRASVADSSGTRSTGSGFSNSGGSMADARSNDRGSVSGYSGNNSGNTSSGKSKGAESRSDGWT